MDRIAIVFGIVLILLGGYGFVATGSSHPTALIPAFIGVVFLLIGILVMARPGLRKHAMHAAAALALLAGGGSAVMAIKAMSKTPVSSIKLISQGGTAVLCFLFLILAIRSFIEARRARGNSSQG